MMSQGMEIENELKLECIGQLIIFEFKLDFNFHLPDYTV